MFFRNTLVHDVKEKGDIFFDFSHEFLFNNLVIGLIEEPIHDFSQ